MQLKIVKPHLKQLSDLISLWEKQYDYHHNLDNQYYVVNSESLKQKFEKYLTKAIKANDPYILIAQVDNKIAGFITFEKGPADYFDTQIKEYGEVIELFVDNQYRKLGIGKKLLAAAEKHFTQRKIKYVKVQSSSFNQNALEFYKHLKYINRQTLLFKKIV